MTLRVSCESSAGVEGLSGLEPEDLLDALFEQFRDAQCQRKTGVKPAPLNGVDRLSGHAELVRELTLAPAALGP